MKQYPILQNSNYDFSGQNYGENCYPNLHKYPATMIPQLGIEVLKELGIKNGKMLDPYCGSGSSFSAGMDVGITHFTGYDINPLAILICKTKFTKFDLTLFEKHYEKLRKEIYKIIGQENLLNSKIQKFKNLDYWFHPRIAKKIQLLKNEIMKIKEKKLRNFFLNALSLTIRDCSYVRNNEFKLYRIKEESMKIFNPDVLDIFFSYLKKSIQIYKDYYVYKLNNIKLNLYNSEFQNTDQNYDIVLTSPPYGDSKTTVAYGQFSLFSNEWLLDVKNARQIDNQLMGGKLIKNKDLENSIINEFILKIEKENKKRADEVKSFYLDLKESIFKISNCIQLKGKSIYIVGNRTVKNITLPTDQFIAECFEKKGFEHLITYERSISNKRMPSLNSPSNKVGQKMSTMNKEYIVICEKKKMD